MDSNKFFTLMNIYDELLYKDIIGINLPFDVDSLGFIEWSDGDLFVAIGENISANWANAFRKNGVDFQETEINNKRAIVLSLYDFKDFLFENTITDDNRSNECQFCYGSGGGAEPELKCKFCNGTGHQRSFDDEPMFNALDTQTMEEINLLEVNGFIDWS